MARSAVLLAAVLVGRAAAFASCAVRGRTQNRRSQRPAGLMDGVVATAEALAARLQRGAAPAYNASRAPPGRVVRCGAKPANASRADGWTTAKPSVGAFLVDRGGVAGDHNHYRTAKLGGTPDRAVSLLTTDVLGALNGAGWPAAPGDLGENVLVAGAANAAFAVGRRFLLGATCVVEISEPIVPCGYLCTLPYLAEKWRCADFLRALRGRRGWYARVLTPGRVAEGDPVVAVAS